jgi:RHS repeat-associated protein
VAEDKGPKGSGTDSAPATHQISAPTISLSKGGGAIRGMGEKFAANPVTGTGSLTVPIATSSGRSGFGPQLSLSYDSGAGNGPYGLGWNLALPSITRKTEKGLPKYQDAVESDVFILSGAEDLVPALIQAAGGQWVSEDLPLRTVNNTIYCIQRYRPRIEGLFARIERWTNQADPTDTFWRSISRDNITTWYGKTSKSRIADPANPTRVFSWLICESYDDKGNVIGYQYKEENSDKVDLSQAHERNRIPDMRKANRYLKRIRYGNHAPYFPQLTENTPWPTLPSDGEWYFEVVLDYGEHDADAPTPTEETAQWPSRNDPFSTYRAGFEIRNYRLCQRVLMFHHFPDETDVGADCLVRSTDFTYSYEANPADAHNPIFSTLLSVSQSGYKRQGTGYLKKSLPPVEFRYTEPNIDGTIHDVDADSLENLPAGLDGDRYQWIDLDGEGLSGILTEQAEGWFYKCNLSPINLVKHNGDSRAQAKFAPVELVATKPNTTIAGGQAQFMDLAGDGQPDLVMLGGPTPGLYEHDEGTSWTSFRPFTSHLNRDMGDPNLKLVDLGGDGHADVLITEDEAFTWHPSRAEEGFGPAQRVSKTRDEERGPALVFADGTQSIYLADLSGDGLTDLVRIRNGEVCYWPNLGYGRFGAKVTMDNAPWFDTPDQFDQRRVHLADIDGSGVTDILYLHGDGVRLYFNQSGNSWSQPTTVPAFPRVDNLAAVTVVDLLGNGTACLVWSSPLPGNARRPMRYIDLMGGQKPHLLVKTVNNLGAETRVRYASSTKFYLQDKQEGKPWITRLPFPVHVVERVETLDLISRNRFVTRSVYHHGYFDGDEREFRGFGMVEQFDTEEFASFSASGTLPEPTNVDAASHVPPVQTKTWFHTGAYLGRDHISDFFAGLLDADDKGEYYREPGLTVAHARQLLLADTVLPDGLTPEEEREACRSLKGAMLRQEVFALDGTDKGQHPYNVAEQNYSIRPVQPRGDNRYAVFFTHACEAITYHYERNPLDPRMQHALTLEVDEFGNVVKSAAVGYGRRQADPTLEPRDQEKQNQIHINYGENRVTNQVQTADEYRTPLPSEVLSYELTGLTVPVGQNRFTLEELLNTGASAAAIEYEQSPTPGTVQKRIIEHVRILYRRNDLAGPLPLGQLQSLALPFEAYKLAFTPGLLTQVLQRNGQLLTPNAADVFPVDLTGNGAADRGGYVDLNDDDHWWIPAGRVFLSPNSNDTAAQELVYARKHFFLPHRFRDPFHTNAVSTESFVTYDDDKLLMVETRDAVGNRVTAQNDYRVLQPSLITNPNRNRVVVAFDALSMVVATAVMGKESEHLGDLLEDFDADPPLADLQAFMADPHAQAAALLGKVTTRIVYDLERFQRAGQPPFAATLARETHFHDAGGAQTKIQFGFTYSDGFGREIQQKIRAEAGDAPQRQADVHLPGGDLSPGTLILDGNGNPVMTNTVHRWVGTGRTVFNNKGKLVRQYEPFFSATHLFEEEHEMTDTGVSPVLFYDPVERVVATVHPNHSYEKVVFDSWQQTTYDVNDTVMFDPKTDHDVKEFLARLPDADYLPTWYGQRSGGQLGSQEQDAATKAGVHANTPAVAHADSLGRTFLTIAHNKFERNGVMLEEKYFTRVELDIEGNQREVIDAKERVVMRYAYDILGNRIHQLNMEAGARWMLNDVAGKPIRAWDSRGQAFRTEYDPLRRPLRSLVTGADPANPNQELLTERLVYGEQHPQAELCNLRGKLYLHIDQAGVVASEVHDFKGNPLRASRRLTNGTQYRQTVDWRAVDADHVALPANATAQLDLPALEAALAPRLEADPYTSRTTYDALNRPVQLIAPRSDQPGAKRNVIQPVYNEANLLERVHVWLNHPIEPTGLLDAAMVPSSPVGVNNIDYDAKGQRLRIEYKNGAITRYSYDPETFRLIHLYTRRGATFTEDCANPQPPPPTIAAPEVSPMNNPCGLQNMRYSYDPSGNITQIQDSAQQTIYFNNQVVTPDNDYTYDAIYRLIYAEGREHIGQVTQPETTWNDEFRVNLHHPQNGQAMRGYTEQYHYDPVGNFDQVIHVAASGNWTRSYAYSDASLVEPTKNSNRLSSTIVGRASGNLPPETYLYDAHGNMLSMPHLAHMEWDFKDELHFVDLGGGGTAYYVYDGAGQLVHKVIERQSGKRQKERIYIGGFEVYREFAGDGTTVSLERETLHVMDDQQRIALVETKTLDSGSALTPPASLIRYQFSNHLGSASLELDHIGQVISYEEYYPYGSTSYQAVPGQTETHKRYRYTGNERDEETGFAYHGARYYAPWLARWTNTDPAGFVDETNLYRYVRNNPMRFVDPEGRETKQQQWEKEFKRDHPHSEKVSGPDPWSSDEGVMTQTGIRVPIHAGNTLLPRHFYEVKEAAFAAYQGYIHLAELMEAGHPTAYALANNYYQKFGRWGPSDRELNLDNYAKWSRRSFSAVQLVQTGLLIAQAFQTLGTLRASWRAGATRPVPTSPPSAPVQPPPSSAPVQPPPPSQAAIRVQITQRAESIVAQANAAVEQAVRTGDTAFFQQLGMSESQIRKVLDPGHGLFKAEYGNAVEAATARGIAQDPGLSGNIRHIGNQRGHVAGTGKPDFVISEQAWGSPQFMDVTTAGARAKHILRDYGKRVMQIVYTIPTFP